MKKCKKDMYDFGECGPFQIGDFSEFDPHDPCLYDKHSYWDAVAEWEERMDYYSAPEVGESQAYDCNPNMR